MKISEEMAVRLHRMMWGDMQKELGDNPSPDYRIRFKEDWIDRMFPGESIANHCWLCEYASSVAKPGDTESYCKYCPIRWPDCHCNTLTFSYKTEHISDILALPARNEKLTGLEAEYIANDKETAAKWYYQYREELLSKASGLPAVASIEAHVKKIQEKAVQQSLCSKLYGDTMTELAKASGLHASAAIEDHIKAIREKASNEKESNGALEKLLSDTVNTLKLYQSALSYESKLPSNAPIADHIKVIQEKAVTGFLDDYTGLGLDALISEHVEAFKEKVVEEYFKKTPGAKLATMNVDQAFKQYADEQKAPIFKELSKASGLSENNHAVSDHIGWIKLKGKQEIHHAFEEDIASIFKELAAESGLESTATVKAHMNAIYSNGFDDGKYAERDRIMDKIGEILKK